METQYTDENGIDLQHAILLVDGHHGLFTAKQFAETYYNSTWHGKWDDLDLQDVNIVWLGRFTNENYDEAWQNILDNATFTDDAGIVYHLYQDQDIWLVPQEANNNN